MRNYYFFSVLIGLMATAQTNYAQLATAQTPDTLFPTHPIKQYELAHIRLASGRKIAMFLIKLGPLQQEPAFTWHHPETRPYPTPQHIAVAQLQGFSTPTHYYEVLAVPEKKKVRQVLAERIYSGPVELFGTSEPKKGVPIPIPTPGAVLFFHTGSGLKFHWYLRQQGQVQAVPEGKQEFAEFMSAFLHDKPDLAAQVAARAEGYQFADLPAIMAAYTKK
jgi:hypothetical protein